MNILVLELIGLLCMHGIIIDNFSVGHIPKEITKLLEIKT